MSQKQPMAYIILIAFFIHLVFLSYLNNFNVAGLPLRSFFVIFCGGLVLLQGSSYVTDLKLLNISYALLSMLGLLVSVINQIDNGVIFAGLFRLLQSYLVIVSGYYLLVNFGYKVIPYTVLAVAVPSAVVGILQAMGMDFAWQIREMLGAVQNTAISHEITEVFVNNRSRPPGLLLFAIPQTYLLLTALAMSLFLYIRAYERGEDTHTFLFLTTVVFVGCVSSETRSAIGAAAILILLTFWRVNFTLLAGAGIAMTMVLMGSQIYSAQLPVKTDAETRVLSFTDDSAKGRMTLYKYGTELVLQSPLGYGYGFNSKEVAPEYFSNEKNIFEYAPTAKVQYLTEVHNALLNITHIYGVIGLAIFVIFVYQLSVVRWFFTFVLVGYLLNAFFHNNGIMLGDLYFDFFISMILYYKYYVNRLIECQPATPKVDHSLKYAVHM
ncbi:MAG: O-antigen ligase [uncultured Thiotrichaceae bacterium]|uniref:O-antigen ligase n=1 Tax=uncultured Thiotrichaceae bacterium TaxID=298394 RepID=A0A6S6TSP1_9GAMM|nr:MAG: O-antigen ligase [uncultured Thiotrichaceae bacterium]